jgi:hypothetical protein
VGETDTRRGSSSSHVALELALTVSHCICSEVLIDLCCTSVPLIDEVCISGAVWVKGLATIEAEAPGVTGVEALVAVEAARGIAVPNLDISESEEVRVWVRAPRDTACKTRGLTSRTMGDDLRG